MSEVQLESVEVKQRQCQKVIWRHVPIGLIFEEAEHQWRYSSELKGEFWSLDCFESSELACAQIVAKRQQLDDFRISQLKK